MLTRRQLIARGAIGAGALALPNLARAAVATGAPRFTKLPRFTVPLPIPATATPTAANTYHITAREVEQALHPKLGRTSVWGYDDGTLGPLYPGPTIEVERGTPTTVMFENRLPPTHLVPIDASIIPDGDISVRTLTHLHGGFVSAADDGNPYHTQLEDEYRHGEVQTVTYPNEQPPATLWYHDHAVAITRTNVYAGLAAYYLIRDSDDTGAEPNPIGIPGGDYEIPIVIQDRTFTGSGELFYPDAGWVPEFFGDTAVVNGAPFPFLEVEPRKYRLRFLNGSNSRFYNLEIAGGPPFQHIGSEGGMFDVPVQTSRILILPAERADVIVDFAGFEGRALELRNVKLPAGVVSPARPNLPLLMQFRVGATVTNPGPATIPADLPGSLPGFGAPARERYITLEEVLDITGEPVRSEIDGLRFDDPVNIQVPAGEVEDWLLINLSADTHPIHLHLPQFEVVERRPFDVAGYQAALDAARAGGGPNPDPAPFYTGGPLPLQTDDRGFKDTVSANPEVVTTIRSPFDLPTGVTGTQKYVFHCHILEHEDNDMMRPYEVLST
ncbi:MAG TPA: multicopper oxidase domain-containing protein [Solirubrobacterales bacterium]|nr:multicopper oxidase domain-containing protein [Solirubrobacterales bacterium]